MKVNQTKVAVAALLCAVATIIIGGDVMYSRSGKITDKCQGWEFIPSSAPGGQTYNQAEGYYSDKGGQLLGPIVPTASNEFEFYSLSFDAKASSNCYWGVLFNDEDGKVLLPDIYSMVYGSEGRQHYEQVIYGRERATGMRPFFQSINGIETWDIQIRPIPAKAAAQWCDRLYQTFPKLSYTPPTKRLSLLPKTVEALKSGEQWRVVMLGDSIINDTFNSNFQALLQRAYPESNLKFICSVRGSTGCWYYKKPEQFKSYIADLKPNLLIIGGISHKNDIDAIRRVIEMTNKEVGCEVLLMSGPLGKDWRNKKVQSTDGLPAQPWMPTPFIEQQRQLAVTMRVEFLDLATTWHNYLGSSQKPYEWFHRDAVHGNDRGKQIVGRIIEAYFKP